MTHLTRVFNPETRSLTSVERRYAGQIGDAQSTVLHFEYTDLQFLSNYVPYIQFAVYDDKGSPLIYGPTSIPTFKGVDFTIPWDVTIRADKARLDYQLFFVKVGVEFDGRDVAKLDSTEYLMSVVDGIALKRSIQCRPCGPHCPPTTSPTTEPDLMGWVSVWKDYGMVVPVVTDRRPALSQTPPFCEHENATEEDYIKDPPVVILRFRTYNGTHDQDLPLEGIPVLRDGKLLYYQLPYGNGKNTVPLLGGDVQDGQSLIYDAASGRFVAYDIKGIYQFRGTCSSADLDWMAASGQTIAGAELRMGDVFSLTDRRAYGFSETGNPEWYEAGTNWVWSEQSRWEPLTGEMDLNNYQLKEFLIRNWDELHAEDDQYPSAQLVKTSLDAKLDDEQVISTWSSQEYDPDLEGQVVQIPSARLVKESLDELKGDVLRDEQLIDTWDHLDEEKDGQDLQIPSARLTKGTLDEKTDKVMAIDDWHAEREYRRGSTVVHDMVVYMSVADGNIGIPPTDSDGVIAPEWERIRGSVTDETSILGITRIIGDGKARRYRVAHHFGTYNVFVDVRTNDSQRRSVECSIRRETPSAIVLETFDPMPVNGLAVSIMPGAIAGFREDTLVHTETILKESQVWETDVTPQRMVTVQTFLPNLYEIEGEVYQNPNATMVVEGETVPCTHVIVRFGKPVRGTMVVR